VSIWTGTGVFFIIFPLSLFQTASPGEARVRVGRAHAVVQHFSAKNETTLICKRLDLAFYDFIFLLRMPLVPFFFI